MIPSTTSPSNSINTLHSLVVPKNEIDNDQHSKIIKQEASVVIAPPPSYQELSSVRSTLPPQMQTANPLLLRQMENSSHQMMTPMKLNQTR